MIKITYLVLGLLMALTGGQPATAQHAHDKDHVHTGHGSHGHHAIHAEHALHGSHDGIHLPPDATLKEWGMDDATIAGLKKLKAKYEDQGVDLRADVEKAEKALARLHDKEDATEDEIHAAIDKLYGAKANLMKLHATAMFEARELMGEEMFAKIHDLHERH